MRSLAHDLREMQVALLAEGFSSQDALSIIGSTIAALLFAAGGDEEGSK